MIAALLPQSMTWFLPCSLLMRSYHAFRKKRSFFTCSNINFFTPRSPYGVGFPCCLAESMRSCKRHRYEIQDATWAAKTCNQTGNDGISRHSTTNGHTWSRSPVIKKHDGHQNLWCLIRHRTSPSQCAKGLDDMDK